MTQVAAKTKTVDGKALPQDQFAYVGDADDISTWHLPIDSDHVGSALKMFGHETHVPASAKAAVARKIVARAKDAGLDTKDFEAKYCKTSEHGEAPRPWIEIFRAGDYSKAGKGVITPGDLDRVVRNYDPTYHEAPVCIGHPKDDMPAFGWYDQLMRDGNTLLARERQVDPKFNEARQAGKFKKRSAAFYCDENGQVTGLRHVAWLGAQPPEVKGLEDVTFNDHGSKFIEVDFGEDETVAAEKTIAEQVKETLSTLFAGMAGKKDEPKTFTEADIKRVADEAVAAVAAPLQAKIAAQETQLAAQTQKFAEREAALAGGEVKQRADAAVARIKASGHWVPAFEKMGLGLVFAELAKTTATVEFGEGDAKKTITPLETLVLFMESLPKIVPGGHVVNPGAVRVTGKPSEDPLTSAARARQKEKGIKFGEALAEVAEEHPELTIAAAPAGSV